MTTTLRSFTENPNEANGTLEATRFGPSMASVHPLVIVLESCNCTWVFDPHQLEFCRILKGITVERRSVATGWRPYWQLEPDDVGEGFTVYLNEARTRRIRSWHHTENCNQCGGRQCADLSADEVEQTLEGHHARCRQRKALR